MLGENKESKMGALEDVLNIHTLVELLSKRTGVPSRQIYTRYAKRTGKILAVHLAVGHYLVACLVKKKVMTQHDVLTAMRTFQNDIDSSRPNAMSK